MTLSLKAILPFAAGLYLDVLRAGQRHVDAHPLKMLPILLLEIFYKVLWLIIVAYPLWVTGKLEGSSAAGTTAAFLWVLLPIIAVPWGYVLLNFIYKPAKQMRPHALISSTRMLNLLLRLHCPCSFAHSTCRYRLL